MDVEAFIDKWSKARGGTEHADYGVFLTEFCQTIGVDTPGPGTTADASGATTVGDYRFEYPVKRREAEALASTLRIDLYKRGCFILEAKQSPERLREAQQVTLPGLTAPAAEPVAGGKWDVLMRNARRQAEDYVFRLPADHPAPPFLIVCDVAHVFELYADFTGTGRAYGPFPDRKQFRVRLEDLRDEAVVDRFRKIWTDPKALDPSREAAKVTREIADRLAAVSKRLERNHPAEEVAHFLMRCIFTMFAEDVDLLPKGEFTRLLQDSLDGPDSFAPLLEELWRKMDSPAHEDRFFSLFRTRLRWFNGGLFKNPRAFPMTREEIGELAAAARYDWRYVEPAIFGTLVEHALEPTERRKLGAHYTPRAYVERLVEATVMEPLRDDWRSAQIAAQDAIERAEKAEAVRLVRAFHHKLCTTRVLDPACGTGNFLYVSLELMKRLEGEVLETLAQLGETESMGLEEVDPHQFLGLELNPRAAAIAELVLWIGYLQQHYRNRVEHPAEPILKAFGNIRCMDAVLTWDGYPELQFKALPPGGEKGWDGGGPTAAGRDGTHGAGSEDAAAGSPPSPALPPSRGKGEWIPDFPNARRPAWPDAEFIVGNPPFIGGKDLRSRMEPGYAEALWRAHPHMNESADFVMYWWDRAAELLTRKKTPLRRFGLVTTNSISQVFQRRVMERHLNAKAPASLTFAVPDHPWTKATSDSAAVRIAMTVAEAGGRDGVLRDVVSEAALETDDPQLEFVERAGRINSDLTVGVDVTRAGPLLANEGLCSPGMKLHGSGFIVTRNEAEALGLGRRPGLERHIREYRNGRDLVGRSRDVMVIDLFGLASDEVRREYPEIYQHLLATVRKAREQQVERSPTADASAYAANWLQFGKPRPELRNALAESARFIATVETAKHRTFQFVPTSVTPDNMLIAIASAEAAHLAVLSSRFHTTWAPVLGGWLGYGNDPRYSKSRCFDPFPFPDPSEAVRQRLRDLGEELDGTRKAVQAEHPDLTLTGLYNALEKLRRGEALDAKDEDVKARGRVLILKDLHDQIDAATADAYGWPRDLTDDQILERLVALNAERAAEEAAGHVRWLRPDYQIPRFAKGAKAKSGELDLGENVVAIDRGLPKFPTDKAEQPLALLAALRASGAPADAASLARGFKGGGKRIEQRVEQALAVLVRYGDVRRLPDGRFVALRAA